MVVYISWEAGLYRHVFLRGLLVRKCFGFLNHSWKNGQQRRCDLLQTQYTSRAAADREMRMWKDKPVQKAAEGRSLGHAKIPLQNKSLWFSFRNTVFLSSWTGFLSPAKLPVTTHADPRAGTELHLGPGPDQPWGCLSAGTAGMNPNFCREHSSKLLGILAIEIQSSAFLPTHVYDAWHEAAVSPHGHPDPGFNSSPGEKPTVPSVATVTVAGKAPKGAKC